MNIDRTIQRLSLALAIAASATFAMSSSSMACPGESPGADADDPGDVVLRMETVGGFAPLPILLLRVPTFTLYENGLAIFQDPSALLMRVDLDDAHTDALIQFALDEGGLAEARSEYIVGGIADATTTVFTLAADGLKKRVSVYALGINDRGPDRAAYRAFDRLAMTLADPGSWLPDDAEVERYEPKAYLGIFAEEDPERPGLVDWPWADLDTSDLQPVDDAPFFNTAVLTPDHVAAVAPGPSSGDTVVFVAGLAGDAYRVMIRPLLPDEITSSVPDP